MANTPLRILLFLTGAAGAAGGTAYFAGALAPAQQPAAAVGASVSGAAVETKPETSATPAGQPAVSGESAEQKIAAVDPAAATAKPEAAPGPTAPTFDVVRVEPNGSIVIAGSAMPGSTVEVIAGSKVLAKVQAGAEGDFAAVLDEPLKPGDYQIVLRATGPGTVVANSVETAVVSIPEDENGQVLALVEQPGAPSKLITLPEAKSEPANPTASEEKPADPVTSNGEPAAGQQAAPAAEPAQPPTAVQQGETATVTVEAVEIEGRKIFIAGAAPAGSTVRVYANEELLGDAKASPDGRFLIETERDLKVGDYIIRADVLGKDGAKVLARAAVPFQREPGEAVAAVAPAAPTQDRLPGAEQTAPAIEAPASAPATETPATANTQPSDGVPPAGDAGANAPAATSAEAGAAPATAPSAAQQPDSPTVPNAAESQAAAEATAPKLEASPSGVIIRRGDSLWRISKRVYGRGMRYSTIYLANQDQIRNPDMIWPGQIFKVPGRTDAGEAADMNAIRGQATTVQ